MSDLNQSTVPPGHGAAGQTAGGWLRTLLIASLAINLMFAGVAAGSFWVSKRHSPFGGGGRPTTDFALQGFISSLPKDRAKELRRVIRQSGKPDFVPLVSAVRQARRDAAGILAAETFDQVKLVEAFAGIDKAEAATKAAARGVIVSVAGHMTPTERKALAERWKARRPQMFADPPRHPEKRHRKNDVAPAP